MVKLIRLAFMVTTIGLHILAQRVYGESDNDRREQEQVSNILAEVSRLMLKRANITKPDIDLDLQIGDDISKSDKLLGDDVRLTVEQAKAILESLQSEKAGKHSVKSVPSKSRTWKLPIKYSFDRTFNESEKAIIRNATFMWASQTCIRFQEYPSNNEIVNTSNNLWFVKGNGCHSAVGMKASSTHQEVTLGRGCVHSHIAAHELGHALGLDHEQNRSDRDNYVTINLQNVLKGQEHNFAKLTEDEFFGCPYDYLSIMHYDPYEFSANKTAKFRTIETLDRRYQNLIELGCYGKELQYPCQNGGYQDPNNCTRCTCPRGYHGIFCEANRRN